VISHDTSFLNAVTNVIAELENKTLTTYRGNFENYLKMKAMRDKEYQQLYESQQKFIKKTKDFIDKNIVNAATTKRAQSRRKMLEKLEVLEKPVVQKKIRFDFPFTASFNMDAVIIKKLQIGYSYAILPPISLKMRFGEKVVIVGKNGVGKTTFLKTILGEIPLLSGEYKINSLNKIAYFSQEFTDLSNDTPVEYVKKKYPLMEDTKVRNLLAQFGIVGELALKTMDKLSGGEQTKVRFALLILEPSNLLILDEPTNHLDKNAKEALFKALASYPGTVILVSHEKEFYRQLQMKEILFG
jgi:ATPase subunit of ABC transporter with duplicated ATPase domains